MGKTRHRTKKANRGGEVYKSYGNRDLLDNNYRYDKTDPSAVESRLESNFAKSDMSALLNVFSAQDAIQNVRNNPTLRPQQKTAMLQPLYQKNAQVTSDFNKYQNRTAIDSAGVDVGMIDKFRDVDRLQKAHNENLSKIRGYGGKRKRRSTRRRRQTKRKH